MKIIINRNAVGIHYEHSFDPQLRRNSIFRNKCFFINKHDNLDVELYNDEYGDPQYVEQYKKEIRKCNVTLKDRRVRHTQQLADFLNVCCPQGKSLVLGLYDQSFSSMLSRFSIQF